MKKQSWQPMAASSPTIKQRHPGVFEPAASASLTMASAEAAGGELREAVSV